MLYKFRSTAAADLIMLEPNGRQLLEIIGKQPSPQGIILPQEMAVARQALEQAVADEVQILRGAAQAGREVPRDKVLLRQRVAPMMDMLRRCEQAGKEIVWGV